MRLSKSYYIENAEQYKQKLLFWSQQFNEVIWLDSNNYPQKTLGYDAILAVDAFTSIQTDYFNAFEKLKEYQSLTNDWIFGYLSYDLKNDLEALTSVNYDGLEFPDLYFFQPKKIFFIKGNTVEVFYLNMISEELEYDLNKIEKFAPTKQNSIENNIKIHLRIHKDAYFQKLDSMLDHIHRGDI